MLKLSYATFGVSTPFDESEKLVTSPVFSSLVLACLRLTIALYTLVYLITILAWDSVNAPDQLPGYFSYFTHLSYIGICAYFWASGVQTALYALGRKTGYPLQRWPQFLQFLHLLLFSTIASFPFVTTIVFWSLLSGPTTFDTTVDAWTNISVHAMNSGFALFEVLLTNAGPTPFTHLPICVILLAGYLGVAYITHATQGFYVYNFLDPDREHGLLAAYIVGIAVGECILFSFSWGIMWLRNRYLSPPKVDEPPESLTDGWEEVSRSGSPSAC